MCRLYREDHSQTLREAETSENDEKAARIRCSKNQLEIILLTHVHPVELLNNADVSSITTKFLGIGRDINYSIFLVIFLQY